jgi:basic membrane lipoprotein Med (substrate-binding protein (PBP1-ABC) superfamily)
MKLSDRKAIGTTVIVVVIIAVLVVAAAGYYLLTLPSSNKTTSTGPGTTTATTGPAQPLKIAIVASGPSTAYFAEFFASGVTQAAATLNSTARSTHVTQAYNVAEANAISVVQSYYNQGYKLFFFYVDYFATYYKIASAVPGATFVDEYLTPNGYNVTTFNYKNPGSNTYTYNNTNTVGWAVDLSGSYYVAGVASALLSQTHKVGFDLAFNIPALAYWYNNYAAGVHSVTPSIPVYYGFTNDWTDPTKGAALTDSLIARGADVVAAAGDTQSIGSAKEAVAKSVYGMGYPVNLNNFSSRWMLGSVYFNATGESWTVIHDYLTNNLAGHYYDLDMAHNGVAFILNPGLQSAGVVTSDIMTKINTAISNVKSYAVTISANPAIPPQPT